MRINKTIKEINKYLTKRDFEKLKFPLQKLHNQKDLKQTPESIKEGLLIEEVKQKTRDLIKEEIKSTLLSQQPIGLVFIELSYFLGSSFHVEIKDLIIEKTLLKYKIILQNSIPIITHMKDIIHSINKLEEIFDSSLVFTARYSNTWNIPGIFIFTASCYLKQKISDFIFLKGIDKNYLPDVIKRLMLFEKKILKKYFIENCCNQKLNLGKYNEIVFLNEDVLINNSEPPNIASNSHLSDTIKEVVYKIRNKQTNNNPNAGAKQSLVNYNTPIKCLHRKMLSRMFIPFLDFFVEYLLDTNLGIDYNSTELNVLSSFIIIFQKIGLALTHINYFECFETKKNFLKISDKKILSLLKKIKSTKKLTEISIALNTLIFIENTLNGLKNLLDPSFNLESIKLKNEKQQTLQENLEYVFKYLIAEKFKKTFSEILFKILKQISFEDLDDSLKKQILNCFCRNVFLKISNSIIRVEDSKIMIHQTDISFEFISKWVDKNPFNTLKKYLFIFSVPPDNLYLFVENFLKYSNGRFSFLHVLRSLDNKMWNEELYLIYTKINNTVKDLGE